MPTLTSRSRVRARLALWSVLALSASCAALLTVAATSTGGGGPDELIRRGFACVGALVCLRYVVAALAALLLSPSWTSGRLVANPGPSSTLPARVLRAVGPAWLKRLAVASVGSAVLASIGTGALAASGSPPTDLAAETSAEDAPSELASSVSPSIRAEGRLGAKVRTVHPADVDLGSPAVHAESDASGPPAAPAPPAIATYTVKRGDSLWRIAQLHGAATDAETADAWPRWYELNRDVIGADPDLIHPGQVLVIPASSLTGADS